MKFHQQDTLRRIIDRIKSELNAVINRFRADCGSFSKEIVRVVEERCNTFYFYIRASNCANRYEEFRQHEEWKAVEIGYEKCDVDLGIFFTDCNTYSGKIIIFDYKSEIAKMPIEYDYVSLYNPQSGFAAFLIPPMLMLIIQQILFLGIGMSAGDTREKCRGSFVPFGRIYKKPFHIALGKTLFYLALYLLLGVYMFAFVTQWFALPQLGDYAAYVAFLIPYLLACISMAMVLSALVYRREDCIMLFVFLSVPLLFLSGILWPGAAVPRFWHYVSWLFPSTFGLDGYVRLQGMGASLGDIAFEMRGLWIQTIVYFSMACLLYRIQIKKLLKRECVELQ